MLTSDSRQPGQQRREDRCRVGAAAALHALPHDLGVPIPAARRPGTLALGRRPVRQASLGEVVPGLLRVVRLPPARGPGGLGAGQGGLEGGAAAWRLRRRRLAVRHRLLLERRLVGRLRLLSGALPAQALEPDLHGGGRRRLGCRPLGRWPGPSAAQPVPRLRPVERDDGGPGRPRAAPSGRGRGRSHLRRRVGRLHCAGPPQGSGRQRDKRGTVVPGRRGGHGGCWRAALPDTQGISAPSGPARTDGPDHNSRHDHLPRLRQAERAGHVDLHRGPVHDARRAVRQRLPGAGGAVAGAAGRVHVR
mmetsp:Transcript_102819/g.291165  ORF Transcript_102819/g.291165 Transcript_102819/m.291165 type:complete len:305 (-) Transcript_102819:341-1255(-)